MGKVIPVDFVKLQEVSREERNSMVIWDAITCELILEAGGESAFKLMQGLQVKHTGTMYAVKLHGQQIAAMLDIEYTAETFHRITNKIALSLI